MSKQRSDWSYRARSAVAAKIWGKFSDSAETRKEEFKCYIGWSEDKQRFNAMCDLLYPNDGEKNVHTQFRGLDLIHVSPVRDSSAVLLVTLIGRIQFAVGMLHGPSAIKLAGNIAAQRPNTPAPNAVLWSMNKTVKTTEALIAYMVILVSAGLSYSSASTHY